MGLDRFRVLEELYVIAPYSAQNMMTMKMLLGRKHCGKQKQDFLALYNILYPPDFLYWKGAILPNINPPSKENFAGNLVFLVLRKTELLP